MWKPACSILLILMTGCTPAISLHVAPYRFGYPLSQGSPYLAIKGMRGTECQKTILYGEYKSCLIGEASDAVEKLDYYYMTSGHVGDFSTGAKLSRYKNDFRGVVLSERMTREFDEACTRLDEIPTSEWSHGRLNFSEIRNKYFWKKPPGLPSFFDWTKQVDLYIGFDRAGEVKAFEDFHWQRKLGEKRTSSWQ